MGFVARKCRDITLFDGENDASNKFTVIIGKNGCGKSRLLKDVCTMYEQQFLQSLSNTIATNPTFLSLTGMDSEKVIDHVVSKDKLLLPSNIIAASTSPFDQFQTKPYTLKRFDYINYYNYVGVKSILKTDNPSVSIASEAMKILFDKMRSNDKKSFSALSSCLKLFGFPTILELEIEFDLDLINYRNELNRSKNLKFSNQQNNKLQKLKSECSIEEIDELVGHYDSLAKYNGRLIIKLSEDGILDLEGKNTFLVPLRILLNQKIAKIRDVKSVFINAETKQHQLFHRDDFKVVRLKNMSSGEQCIFLLLLGIASKLKDNSLICIDEPELSLHPAWQMSFMNAIINSFSIFNGCHFIISTHSPQIISNITSQSCVVLNLESGVLEKISNFKHRSSDFQLATLFKTPGYKNEYLLNEAVSILSSFSKGVNDENLKNKAIKFLTLRDYTHTEDPINDLFQIIELALNEA